MKVDIHHISPVFHQLTPVVTGSVKDNMNLLTDRIGFTQGNEELGDVITVDTVILAYPCFTDIGQIQGAHQVQTGTTSRGFHRRFLAFTHPAISQFRSLRGMDAINEQDGLMVSGFLLQFPVGFHKGPLLFRVELVWHAGRFFITEAIVVQPFIHAGNGVTDIPLFFDKADSSLCGGQKIRGQISR